MAFLFQVLARAAGAEDFHAGGGQALGKGRQTDLVADADQGALDGGRLHRNDSLRQRTDPKHKRVRQRIIAGSGSPEKGPGQAAGGIGRKGQVRAVG